ncbi:MAG: nucleotidyl transferase AbiEii/AbiGii toxin family protein [Bacteroidetes bacterium]|nr:nucleotidyl transferase AbiEii/AbiGii toxin family protein [Bacteroidota bacterium]
MILQETLTKDWIDQFNKQQEYRKADTNLIEKMIFALYLVEQLVIHNCKFIFKGGTSLILLLGKTYRFSIDIDIVTSHTKTELEKILDNVVKNSSFIRWEFQEARSSKKVIPSSHYTLYFISPRTGQENIVLLDKLYSNDYLLTYPKSENLDIRTPWLKTNDNFNKVIVPDIDSILGDKLTAFAPGTSGVQYNDEKSLQIAKQLFDVSLLIDQVRDHKIVTQSFLKIAEQEITFRKNAFTVKDIYDDVFNAGLLIAKNSKLANQKEVSSYTELKDGIDKLINYLPLRNFRLPNAIEASAKAACFMQHIKHDALASFVPFKDNIDLTALEITNTDYNFINRFKKTNKPAFHYWYNSLKLNNLLN